MPPRDPTSPAPPREWTFDDGPVGAAPVGFTAAKGEWALTSGGALAQRAASASADFNVILADDTSHRDLDLSVRLQAQAGEIDQGGGLVWRAADTQNYYIARYNPLEDNFRVYRVKNGKRQQIESADVRVDHTSWHTLRITQVGSRIECYLDGTRYLEATDTTFGQPGRIGLWTKADARTHFDNLAVTAVAAPVDARAVGAIMGAEPSTSDDGVVTFTWPRDAVAVAVDGATLPPSAGLTTWAGFQATAAGAMVMGDTVVFEDEVDAAMDAAFAGGLEVTALHNHFFFDVPKVYFMHIGGHGDAAELARAVRATWDAVRAVRTAQPTPARAFAGAAPVAGAIDAAAIGSAIGFDAATKPGGVVKVTIARQAQMHGAQFGASMGLSTWAAFSGSDARAAMDGDVAMTAAEVQPVLRALRAAGIHVVALHNHMIGETPAYYFTHFWAKGSAADLARGFRSVLDAQAVASPAAGR